MNDERHEILLQAKIFHLWVPIGLKAAQTRAMALPYTALIGITNHDTKELATQRHVMCNVMDG